ncbi:TonB-dependent receptor domain-containing protein [Qipengyuania sp. 902]|uniref:TonB-dependent receptor domain-containing protein n=1 Tax=Qipengyuania sp. 902 TaxID=3417565 RepID=UPI003EBBB1CF
MKKTFSTLGGRAALFTGAGLAALALATPAYAQDVDTSEQDASDTADEGPDAVVDTAPANAIIVSGSRIARPNLESPVPVTSVTAEDLTNQGDISLGDALNDLPSLRTTFSQGNSTRFIGTAGLNLLDLRGLGTSRTLVLVNGKRHITALPGDFIVDVNTIPVDLLERVDVVTGGNSAVYGSDAVAGVVNFILKRDFEGFAVRGQAGISEEGDRATRFISATYGKNFADGRGNIAVSGEYAKSDPLYFRQRDDLTGAYSGRCQYNVVSDDQSDEGPFGSDGITDLEPICGVRNGSISDGGTLGGLGGGVYLRFAPNGDLFVDTPDDPLPFSGNVVGGGGSTLRNTGQLAAGLERYTANILARFDVTDAFRPFVEAKYVRLEAIQEGQPSFFVGGPTYVGGNPLFCDNAFLNDQALGTLQSYGLCSAGRTNTQTVPLSRFNIDFGGRGELQTRETYRIVGGIEGTFNDDWNYELSANYGRLETDLRSLNNLVLFDLDGNPAGFNLAADAVLNGAGNPVCRINADSDPSNDDPNCVPINLFGFGAPSQAALDYVNTTGRREGNAEQFVVLASLAGDLSGLFELPGGPIAFAIGGEYREERAYEAFDELTASGGTFLNAIQPFDPPALKVKEAFGELRVPLLADLPFAEELTLNGAARVSDYNTATGTTFSWNVNGIYAPIPDIRFRAGYAVSVRAPTLSDLYSPQSQNFAFLADPCDRDTGAINNNPNRAANCAAAGVPTTVNAAIAAACAGSSFPVAVGDQFTNCLARTASTGFTSGGNPNLTEEKGKSLTLGVVLEPRFLPGFSVTVDYYNIEIEDQIAVLGAQTILNNCYDSPTGIDNPFCTTVSRDATTGLFVEPAVLSGGINFASRETEGIDIDVRYNRTFDNGNRLSVRAIATHLLKLNFFEDPTSPINPNRIKSELGDPDWAASLNTTYDFGDVALTWSARYIGPMYKSAYENQNPYQGLCPTSGVVGSSGGTCTPGELVTLDPANADQYADPTFSDKIYNNFRITWDVQEEFSFYLGVDNAFDVKPPFGQLGIAGGEPYDNFGRYWYAGFNIEL